MKRIATVTTAIIGVLIATPALAGSTPGHVHYCNCGDSIGKAMCGSSTSSTSGGTTTSSTSGGTTTSSTSGGTTTSSTTSSTSGGTTTSSTTSSTSGGTTVPEPGMLGMMGLGFIGMAAARRRRR